MGNHVARPSRRVALRVLGGEVRLGTTQVHSLRHFGPDGLFNTANTHAHVRVLTNFVKKGWAQRTRGTFMLTENGLKVKAALDEYLERKREYLSKGKR